MRSLVQVQDGPPQSNEENGVRGKSWGYSSVGRAPALQAGCQRFKSAYLHHSISDKNRENRFSTVITIEKIENESAGVLDSGIEP